VTRLDIRRIRGLCFDVDGTLADTDDQAVHWLSRLMRPARLINRSAPQRLARRTVMALETPLNALITLADRLRLDELLRDFPGRPPSSDPLRLPEPVPGVLALLPRLAPHYRMAVVTSRGPSVTTAFLQAYGLANLFKAMVTSRSTLRLKPHPAPIVLAARQLGLTPAECLVIGDTTVDIRSGRAAGAQTVGVLCGFGEADELWAAGADCLIESTADLGDLLLNS
jgi:phosphoglycolate phosphatase-like HAD superfamily hydrolase